MSIEGQGHFFTIYFRGVVCFVLYWAKISGERLQDHWSSGYVYEQNLPRGYMFHVHDNWATTRENVPSDKSLTFNETSLI